MLRRTILLILVAVALLAAFAWLSKADWGRSRVWMPDNRVQSCLFVRNGQLGVAHGVFAGHRIPGIDIMILSGSWGGFEWEERRGYIGPEALIPNAPVYYVGRRAKVPLWFVILACSAYPAIAFIRGPLRRWRRRKRGLCVKCGYDLTGNVSGACPECAHPVAETASR